MVFTSFAFLIFTSLFLLCYFLVNKHFRIRLMIISGFIFYISFIPQYIFIPLIQILTGYFGVKMMEKSKGRTKNIWLIINLAISLSVIGFFKYSNFLSVVPIGISFQTIQLLSYIICVYKREFRAVNNIEYLILYLLFFPVITSGPIERPKHLIPQFHKNHNFNTDRAVSGSRLILWGYFKKIVIADRMAIYVNQIYDHPSFYSGPSIILAVYLFALELYFDFSAYSDIAMGISRIMGINLISNFSKPYFATSISDFWRRWHISLTSWLRDYIYIPLGGNRVNKYRWMGNIIIIFLISGLWHGLRWTYIIWGMILGVLVISERFYINLFTFTSSRLYKFLKIFLNFHLVAFSWIFFRSNSVGSALIMLKHLLIGWMYVRTRFHDVVSIILVQGLNKEDFLILIFTVSVIFSVEYYQTKRNLNDWLSTLPTFMRWGIYYVVVLAIIFFGENGIQKFIYFQF